MPEVVLVVLIFVSVGAALLGLNLLLGRLIRPDRPNPMKTQVYECGEQPVGSAWVQFDLRFYVVALLFVVFDVEIAFFFPWAVIFGSAQRAADPTLPLAERQAAARQLQLHPPEPEAVLPTADALQRFATLALADLAVFFGVLLVGYAYLWRRGDLYWVRSTAAQQTPEPTLSPASPPVVATSAASPQEVSTTAA
ncbi:MAG: NADH-quinone oxidoreductase subunit A [Thermogemmata sp.]|jgi:NADH-quinone oxidoreductase subunit A|uniref:NADH-quinone oxidoreductase subunit A n=1 Tax=Thermogemmata fonticola TaxID=2755323 RepID=A0A7V8VH28_9BACT|nr:NADH-quinone oxidoreductase subunit A [Thermogemmata fonticola]MBA2227801.1 NADH-quinone oxidoreductase subunit A [Thermogemmata fonticola]MCX8140131.1 NADH-quinone oxidoreductase subunit A [Gemmataceae bacterium]GIW83740.1 MAG: NADH-quinone oxidoreductase subunit A [Gemmataceae bacterium]